MDDEPIQQTADERKRVGYGKLVFLVAAIVALTVAAKVLPVKQYMTDLVQWVEGIGAWGPAVIIVMYVLACVFMVPGIILTLASGFLFKLVLGTITVSIASTLGACAAFLAGRFLARDWIAHKVAGNPRFNAIDKAVGREGFKIVLLTRLSPIFPFNMLNYAFGLTKVSFMHYALASWIGMLPGTVMYVYLGSAARSLTDAAIGGGGSGTGGKVMFAVGLVVAIFVAVFVARIAKRAIAEAVPDDETPGEGENSR
jgi:uncharacterized membrane protein YdjX (TVP38/TMEM64 family)